MHYAKIDSIIYLFRLALIPLLLPSFADVEESGKMSLNECLLSHFLMSIHRRYSDMIAPSSQHDRWCTINSFISDNYKSFRLFSNELRPPEIHVKVNSKH